MTVGRSEFRVFGPYPIPFARHGKGTSKRITKEHAKLFWAQLQEDDIGSKHGCYVFALKVSGGFSPWYVGKATKTFAQEALQDHKLVYYNDVIYRGRRGLPVLFFVANPDTKLKIPPKQIDDMETFLIQTAAYKNHELKNQKKSSVPEWGIRGVVRGGKGKAPDAAKRFKAMMGL